MSKEVKGYPHKQGFCVNPVPCKSKRNSWWNPSSSNYWVSKRSAVKKTAGQATSAVAVEVGVIE